MKIYPLGAKLFHADRHDMKKLIVTCHNFATMLEQDVQGGSNMTGTAAACLHTNQSRSYLNHLV